ncbi:MAG: hypothetical protein K1X66_07715 [Verrucomicrobiae bacterium]|nr:hypothetical protein [Verrucomicrobiae bacterium]
MKSKLSLLGWLLFTALMTYGFYMLLQHSHNGFLQAVEQEGRRVYQFFQRQFK